MTLKSLSSPVGLKFWNPSSSWTICEIISCCTFPVNSEGHILVSVHEVPKWVVMESYSDCLPGALQTGCRLADEGDKYCVLCMNNHV